MNEIAKIHLNVPKVNDKDLAEKASDLCNQWAEKIGLLEHLRYILYEYDMHGEVFIFSVGSSEGWNDIQVVPPERISTNGKTFELLPSSDEGGIVEEAATGDPEAVRIVNRMLPEVVQAIKDGGNTKFNTDPNAGSFLYHLTRKKSPNEDLGHFVEQQLFRPMCECAGFVEKDDSLRKTRWSILS